MPEFEALSGNEEAVAIAKARKKWKPSFLRVPDQALLFRELTSQLPAMDFARIYAYLTYLTAGRRNEVLALTKGDFSYEIHKDLQTGKEYSVLLIQLITQKNKTNADRKFPAVKGINPIDDEIIKEIEDYIKPLEPHMRLFRKLDPTRYDHLLNKCKITARYFEPLWAPDWRLEVRFSLFPHFLRHCRLTYFSPLDVQSIMYIAGWSSSSVKRSMSMMDIYVQRNYVNVIKDRIAKGV
jgi:integrase